MTRFLFGRLGLILAGAILLTSISECAHATTCTQLAQVTLTGNFRSANGLPLQNGTMALVPSQQGLIAGCGVNLALTNVCGTSVDGSVVGVPNPLTATVNTSGGAGSLPSGTYYTVIEWYDAAGNVSLPSPETRFTLSITSSLVVNPPSSGMPANAVGMKVFISTTSGTETLQGSTVGSASFVQSTALVSGASPSATNTTLCQIVANDAVWPTGTGYNVSLTDRNGNPIPGYPMQWQLLGPGTTYNLSNGLPYYHGVVYYPVPVLTQPANHGQQSISGPLSLTGYNLTQVGRLGVGTAVPGYGVDVEGPGINGVVNAATGYLFNGNAGTVGQALCSDGTYLDAFCSFIPAGTTFYYQQMQSNAVDQTQRAKLNFSSRFVLSDSSSPSRTNVELATAGTPGTYTNPSSITTDAYGRVTAATSGVAAPFHIVALWNGVSGTLVDDSEGGSGYQSGPISWGTTITGTYYVDCFTTGWTSGGTLGQQIVATVVGFPTSSTTFTYGVDIPTISAGRTHTIPSVTCMAIQ